MYPLHQYTDQMGHQIELQGVPKKVVSLVPSQTELLYYLGVKPVGQTVFCIHPSNEFKSAKKIGGTKKLQLDAIRTLQPDLIIGNKEENDAEQIKTLQAEFPVWMSDINTVDDSYDMLRSIGHIFHKTDETDNLIFSTQEAFNRLIAPNLERREILYLIWNKPFYGVGTNTFIHDVLDKSGFSNALKDLTRYPELTVDEINNINPDYIFLSSEPFPFKEEHKSEIAQLCPNAKVVLVDGEMFSWYGNRLRLTPKYINQLNFNIRRNESKS
ncbi:MAG: ABC transporter substrate-binding protein [Bacteroidetes bacterium]|jgi:ABC-type Fe3+-hydroxamate transport system substrate-binding protein|nr:ABC transporter substrate-binding protein [Bacteroidota bacterium]